MLTCRRYRHTSLPEAFRFSSHYYSLFLGRTLDMGATGHSLETMHYCTYLLGQICSDAFWQSPQERNSDMTYMKYLKWEHFLSVHSSFLDRKRFPRISTIAYEQEQKMLQNEVHLVKKLWALFEIWQPWHPFFGNPEKQISYSCILDNGDTDSDAFWIFRVTIDLFFG